MTAPGPADGGAATGGPCWLCAGLGALAIHNKATAEFGKTLWIGHRPESRSHPVRPCPVCEVVAALLAQARAEGAEEERERIVKELFRTQSVPPARRLSENAGPHGGVCYEFHPVCARWRAFNEAMAIARNP